LKTKIKKAHWKSKELWGDEYMDIVTTVYYQGEDAFIDSDSKFLFQMICENFFRQFPEAELNITLKSYF
jgi:hypothetical protein